MNTDHSSDTAGAMLADDRRRRAARAARERHYDPLRGIGACGRRVRVRTPLPGMPSALVPESMTADPAYAGCASDPAGWSMLRCRHDFEYWCAACVHIKHKTLGCDVPFVLNAPQRSLAALLEADRTARRPMRVIMLKARQWGGSTLVQMYMAWIQSCLRRNWHSLICAHVKDTAASIRGMYTRMLASYPPQLWDGDEPPRFKPFERSANVREIAGRGCRVTVGSAESADAVRGADYAMAHLSETAFWPSTPRNRPADFIRAVCGSIALMPDSLVVMESTANGVGSYFHTEWLRCRDGAGDKRAVFVPWYEIEIYRLEPPDPRALAESLSAYERMLWHSLGLCLDQIYWYRCKSAEYADRSQMMAEFPTTDTEAFMNTGRGVFAVEHVEALRRGCTVEARRGELCGGVFRPDPLGCLKLWHEPQAGAGYVVAVDIGGRSEGSDWSVIAVLRRASAPGGRHEVAAQWRGHIDHDLLVGRAEALARYYNRALLIIESNTLESECSDTGDPNLYVLRRLARRYSNLYKRAATDRLTGGSARRPGFHTNRATKQELVTGLIAAVRDGTYTERDAEACNEMLTYEQLPGGAYAAREGRHDDIVMTRALALHALGERGCCHGASIAPPRALRW